MPCFSIAHPVSRPWGASSRQLYAARRLSCSSVQLHRTGNATNVASVCCCAERKSVLRAKISELAGEERGIFGLDGEIRQQIHDCIEEIEAHTPNSTPARNNAAVAAGSWRLLYTTLTILGRRRVRLAIGTATKSGFIRLGEFYQIIDPEKLQSRNVVVFDMALGGSGTFTINANYTPLSDKRVSVEMTATALQPHSLETLLGDKVSLLTEIFDPTGYLDITFIDHDMRVGRDDKNNIFVLERCSTE